MFSNTVVKKSKLSGSENRKRKLERKNQQEKLKKSMNIFLQKKDENIQNEKNLTADVNLNTSDISNQSVEDIENVRPSCMVVEVNELKNHKETSIIQETVCSSIEEERTRLTDIGN